MPLRMSTRLDASVLGNRDFRLLWTGQAISAIGDMVFPVAVEIFVLDSGGDVGLVLAARFAALVLFALFGGGLPLALEAVALGLPLSLPWVAAMFFWPVPGSARSSCTGRAHCRPTSRGNCWRGWSRWTG